MKGRGIIVDLFFLFLSDEWGMKGYEEGGIVMMVVRKGKGSWHIMKRQDR
jgi:hypothetical protein